MKRIRGEDDQAGRHFSYVDFEARLRQDHPRCAIQSIVNEALASLAPRFAALYSKTGRPLNRAGASYRDAGGRGHPPYQFRHGKIASVKNEPALAGY